MNPGALISQPGTHPRWWNTKDRERGNNDAFDSENFSNVSRWRVEERAGPRRGGPKPTTCFCCCHLVGLVRANCAGVLVRHLLWYKRQPHREAATKTRRASKMRWFGLVLLRYANMQQFNDKLRRRWDNNPLAVLEERLSLNRLRTSVTWMLFF